MAVKDHSLDKKITDAAREEFLILGFHKASLHKIAEKAGITTGALYTRYKGKDDLFCSLLKDFLKSCEEKSLLMRDEYASVMKSKDPMEILPVIKAEEKLYMELLFSNYDDCVLLFCKSDGSSIEEKLKAMMDYKAKSTVSYLKSISKKPINTDGIELIMSEQFRFFRSILEKGYDRERSALCIESIEEFMDAGWKELFKKMQ